MLNRLGGVFYSRSARSALDIGAYGTKLLDYGLVTTVDMINPVNEGLAFCA